jgi:hypothetical protein
VPCSSPSFLDLVRLGVGEATSSLAKKSCVLRTRLLSSYAASKWQSCRVEHCFTNRKFKRGSERYVDGMVIFLYFCLRTTHLSSISTKKNNDDELRNKERGHHHYEPPRNAALKY